MPWVHLDIAGPAFSETPGRLLAQGRDRQPGPRARALRPVEGVATAKQEPSPGRGRALGFASPSRTGPRGSRSPGRRSARRTRPEPAARNSANAASPSIERTNRPVAHVDRSSTYSSSEYWKLVATHLGSGRGGCRIPSAPPRAAAAAGSARATEGVRPSPPAGPPAGRPSRRAPARSWPGRPGRRPTPSDPGVRRGGAPASCRTAPSCTAVKCASTQLAEQGVGTRRRGTGDRSRSRVATGSDAVGRPSDPSIPGASSIPDHVRTRPGRGERRDAGPVPTSSTRHPASIPVSSTRSRAGSARRGAWMPRVRLGDAVVGAPVVHGGPAYRRSPRSAERVRRVPRATFVPRVGSRRVRARGCHRARPGRDRRRAGSSCCSSRRCGARSSGASSR